MIGEKGTIVFTGQPGNRKIGNKTAKNGKEIWKGKYYEFVFPSKVEKRFEIPSVTYKEFISIHKDSSDYLNLWKKKLQDGEKIPVFIVLSSDTASAASRSSWTRRPSGASTTVTELRALYIFL